MCMQTALCLALALSAAQAAAPQEQTNAEALELVRAGKIDIARASWWGFDPEDSTDALQAAI